MEPVDFPDTRLFQWSYEHPLLANLAFDVSASLFSAMICTVGIALALLVPNRKIVYGMTLLLWLVPMVMKKSLALLFQPFAEYGLDELLPIFLVVTVSYALLISITTVWRLNSEEI